MPSDSLTDGRSRIEKELASIHQKLDHISTCLSVRPQPSVHTPASTWQGDSLTYQDKLPFQLLGTEQIFQLFGLEQGFAERLHDLERRLPMSWGSTNARMRLVHQQRVWEALGNFSSHVHVWYPLLRPGFSERYMTIISGNLSPSSESCLALLVAGIGLLAMQDQITTASGPDPLAESYIEAAMSSLPTVVLDNSVESVQSLILFAIHYCCLSQPCHAYEYVMIASLKVQNLLMRREATGLAVEEHLKRAYWTVLLLESELRVQFNLAPSHIWQFDDHVALPNSSRAWQFDVETGSPITNITTPRSMTSTSGPTTDRAESYFLAEIAMRRMLHRCNTAIHKTPEGEIVYAPAIARELELQLDEWYSYLPSVIRFDKHQDLDFDLLASPGLYPQMDNLSSFLRVQYYCCKISIYWPAVYQCIRSGSATWDLLQDVQKFFDAYIQAMPSILMSVRECVVNRWTLFATIFMTSMAATVAVQTACIRQDCEADWPRVFHCFEAIDSVDKQIRDASPSAALMFEVLLQKLADLPRSVPHDAGV